MWTHLVVVLPPVFDHDLSLLQCVKDFTVEQFVAQLTSVTPIARIASATSRPCAISTSTCRSFATISSAVCLFLTIDLILHGQTILQRGPLQRGQIIRIG